MNWKLESFAHIANEETRSICLRRNSIMFSVSLCHLCLQIRDVLSFVVCPFPFRSQHFDYTRLFVSVFLLFSSSLDRQNPGDNMLMLVSLFLILGFPFFLIWSLVSVFLLFFYYYFRHPCAILRHRKWCVGNHYFSSSVGWSLVTVLHHSLCSVVGTLFVLIVRVWRF